MVEISFNGGFTGSEDNVAIKFNKLLLTPGFNFEVISFNLYNIFLNNNKVCFISLFLYYFILFYKFIF